MLANLEEIPSSLLERCDSLIGVRNQRHRLNFDNIIWHKETAAMIASIQDTFELLRNAEKARRRTTRDENLAMICTAILALEILNADLFGWGTMYPTAKRKAEHLLAHHGAEDKRRMISIFNMDELETDRQLDKMLKNLFNPHRPFGFR